MVYKEDDNNELFKAAHLTILITYSIFSVILIAESLLLNWEKWPLFAIAGGVILSWVLHIQQTMNEKYRIWIYSVLIMFTFFFYGSHTTSVFDTVAVMSVVIILYTMTGIKNLITFLQIIYYITLGYGLGHMWVDGYEFNSLIITRAILHFAVITAVSHISKVIIRKWRLVLDHSKTEIENLTDATDRLNDFLANVSHEIRTPVNAVIGLTGICIEEETDDKKLNNLMAIRDAGRRVAEQIGDILDYSEIDRNRLTNNYEDYMISSLLNDLVSEMRPYISDNIELIIDVDPAIPSVLHSDVTKIRKILRHLMINGLKYTRNGGVYVRISMEKEPYGVNLLIEVTDTGIGMSEEETERISDRFYQADSGRSRQGGGLGIGMSIVSGFVSSLGGFMMVNSKTEHGTSVKVSLPQKVTDPESCMSVNHRDSLCLGAYLHFEKFENPLVREYYNDMVRNIVNGLNVQMHRVENVENLKKLMDSVQLTHLFVGEEEYNSVKEYLEDISTNIVIIVVADREFKLTAGSKARIMEKPFYCFPVVSILNSDPRTEGMENAVMYCRGVRALVVDDEPMNLTVARSIFNRYGMTVTTAASGQDAIDLCRETDFDIIFMDHMMPGMDGVEAMKRISIERAKIKSYIPIVALTANAVSTAKEMFLSEGFDGFVSKPIELVELERVIKRVLPASMITYEIPGSAEKTVPDVPYVMTFEPEEKKVQVTEDKETKEQEIKVQEKKEIKRVKKERARTDANEYDSEFIKKLKNIGIAAETGLNYCIFDEEFYKTVLLDYTNNAADRIKNMENFFKENDLKNYMIEAHSLKSTSKMLGIMELSEEAKLLENAAREEDAEYIKQHHSQVIREYKSLTDSLSNILT